MKTLIDIENENLIRTQWLKSFKMFFSIFSIYYLVKSLVICKDGLQYDLDFSIGLYLLVISLWVIIISLFLSSQYYFGYKKKGINLLVWTSLFGSLIAFSTALTTLADITENFYSFGFLNPRMNFYYILDVSFCVLFAYYLYYCWQLCFVNSELRKQNS